MIRWGLCCIFKNEPIKFRRTTAAFQLKKSRQDQLHHIAELCLQNARALLKALQYCHNNGIGLFRINSQILPLITHPEAGYQIDQLPGHKKIVNVFRQCGQFAKEHSIRTSFHPDQFVVLNSKRKEVREKSIEELAYQAMVADWVNADVINLHAGGVYGDKPASLARLKEVIPDLPEAIRNRLTLENDDRAYTLEDLLPIARETGIPIVYDVHHHRCLPDRLSEEEATRLALETWEREPLFHISSPRDRTLEQTDRRHADYIHIEDFPDFWHQLDISVEVEAKAKESAVLRLKRAFSSHT